MIPLLIPTATEGVQDFIQRFVKDEAAGGEYPLEDDRRAIARALWNRRDNALPMSWPKICSAPHIEPGLVKYKEFGVVLLRKPALDKMLASFIGKAVINEVHKDVRPETFKDLADGIVFNHWYNAADGWYWVDFLVWDPTTIRNVKDPAYGVSCAYDPTEFDYHAGIHNNMGYDQEILDGQYNHLAIVRNPRYEGASRIVVRNSKDEGSMIDKLFFWRKGQPTMKNALDPAAMLQVEGQPVSMQALIDTYKQEESGADLSDDTEVEIEGKVTNVGMLKRTYINSMRRKNEADEKEKERLKNEKDAKDKADKEAKESEQRQNAEDMEKAHEKGDHKDKALDNCARCSNTDEKEKERLKNEADEKERKEKEEKERRENSLADENFKKLQQAASMRGTINQPKILTRDEQAARGKQRYGSTPKK